MTIDDLFHPKRYRYFQAKDHVFIPFLRDGDGTFIVQYIPRKVDSRTPCRIIDGKKYFFFQERMSMGSHAPLDFENATEVTFEEWAVAMTDAAVGVGT